MSGARNGLEVTKSWEISMHGDFGCVEEMLGLSVSYDVDVDVNQRVRQCL